MKNVMPSQDYSDACCRGPCIKKVVAVRSWAASSGVGAWGLSGESRCHGRAVCISKPLARVLSRVGGNPLQKYCGGRVVENPPREVARRGQHMYVAPVQNGQLFVECMELTIHTARRRQTFRSNGTALRRQTMSSNGTAQRRQTSSSNGTSQRRQTVFIHAVTTTFN